MTGDELDNYMKECSLYPDGTIRDNLGNIIGSIDTNSDTWKELIEGIRTAISFHIVKDSDN